MQRPRESESWEAASGPPLKRCRAVHNATDSSSGSETTSHFSACASGGCGPCTPLPAAPAAGSAASTPGSVARALCAEAGKLSLQETVHMLAAAMRAQARVASPANKAALGQFCGHAALRLVRAVTPLQDFLGPATQRAAWAAMPLEVVEVLLHHPELGVDVEETALEAAIMWLDRNLDALSASDQPHVVTRLLRRIRWYALQPYALLSCWERSRGVRLFDPRQQLALAVLAVQQKAAAGDAACQAACTPRPCASGVRELVHTFEVAPVDCQGRPCAVSSQEVFSHGLLWSVLLRPVDGGARAKLCLRACHPPAAQAPVPFTGSGKLAGPVLKAHLQVERPGREAQPPAPRAPKACTMAYSEQRSRVEGLFSAVLDLSAQRSAAGAPLTWEALFAPGSPLAQAGAIRVAAAVEMVA